MEQNWAGTYRYGARAIHQATTVAEVQDAVARSPRIRALGTRHSFNAVADSTGDLVTVTAIAPDFDLDEASRTVTVGAGTRYGVLAAFLESRGWALHNMGSLPHISIAGAIATGTHGSGNSNGILSTAVNAIELVTASGGLRTVRRGEPDFDAMVVGLGLFGVVVRVSLDIQPSYLMRQDVYVGLPWHELLADLEGVTGAGYSVSVFLDWVQPTVRLRVKTRLDSGAPVAESIRGARRDDAPAPAGSNLTAIGGVTGLWLERLPHFRLDSTPSSGDEIQTEYFVDRADGHEALAAVRALGESIAPHLIITELRTTAADELWLSPAYQRPSLGIHFTWKNEPEAVSALLPRIEAALAPFRARPHWGKLTTVSGETVRGLYPRLGEFRALVDQADPTGKFSNAHLDELISR